MIFVDFIYFRSFSPLFFLSQSLVFVTVVFIILGRCSLPVHVVFLLLVCQYSAYCLIVFSFSFVSCSWCYWVFFFVCNYVVIATDCWSVPGTYLWSVVSVSVSFSFSSRFSFSSCFSVSSLFLFMLNIFLLWYFI